MLTLKIFLLTVFVLALIVGVVHIGVGIVTHYMPPPTDGW